MDYAVHGILQAIVQYTGPYNHSFLQGIFPTEELNPGLPYCRQISLPAEPPGKLLQN